MSLSVIVVLVIFGILIIATLVMLYRIGALRFEFSPAIGGLGAWLLFIAAYTLIGRLLIETDGTVIARQVVNNPRPETFYTMRAPDGQSYAFSSGATDASLSRGFAVGRHITKHKWQLGYALDGREVSDFPITFYSIMSAIGASLLWFSVVLLLQRRKRPNQSMQLTPGRRTAHL
jgi:hypothetical protein